LPKISYRFSIRFIGAMRFWLVREYFGYIAIELTSDLAYLFRRKKILNADDTQVGVLSRFQVPVSHAVFSSDLVKAYLMPQTQL